MAVGIVGPGLIGGTLIEQLRKQVYLLIAILEIVSTDSSLEKCL